MVTWSIYCHSKTNLSQKQIPDDYFEYNSAYVRKRQAYSVRTIKSTKWMHTEWHKWLFVIGLSWQSEADPGEGPGGPAPRYPTLFLDQTEAWRAKKICFGDWAPPYRRVWMTLTYISPYFLRGGVGLRKYKKLKDLFILKLEFYQP